jgi:hypothetical protein
MFNFLKRFKKQETTTVDFADVVLSIDSVKTENEATIFVAKSTIDGTKVGFEIVVYDISSKVNFDGDNSTVISAPDGIEIRSIGNLSNNFIQVFAKRCGISTEKGMIERISFTSIALDGSGSKIMTQPVRFKLFYEEDDYVELFINIDAPNKQIDFQEKDIDYREPLVKVLSSN